MASGFISAMPTRWVAVTPSDSTDLTGSIGFRVGGNGDVAVRCFYNPSTTVTFTGCVAGEVIPGNFTRIMAATTATDIVAAYA